MFYEVLTILFFTSTLLDILYLILSTWVIIKTKKVIENPNKEAVSIVIAAKNELNNLKKHLPLLLEQNYPLYEIIIVSDNSTDGSNIFLENYSLSCPKLKIIKVTENTDTYNSKKFALKTGIEAAKYPLILLTDADCFPASKNWVSEMSSYLSPDKDIVLGTSPFIYKKNSFLNDYQQFENITTAISYLFFALIKLPYMGVGRNVLYRKSTFLNEHGFKGIEKINGGDDDLFLQKIMTSKNTAVSLSKHSLVYTYPKASGKKYIQQKSRHYSVGSLYKAKPLIALSLVDLTKSTFYLCSICLLITDSFLIFTIVFSLRMAIFLLSYYLVTSKLYIEKTFKYSFVIFDGLYIIQRNLLGLLSLIFNPKKW